VHDHFRHAARRPVARALEDDVFHLAAAQVLNALLAEDPCDGVGNVALTAAVRTNDGSDSVSSEDYFGVVGEGFKASDFQALEFEHSLNSSCLSQPRRLSFG
jgi:hypothetical protein